MIELVIFTSIKNSFEFQLNLATDGDSQFREPRMFPLSLQLFFFLVALDGIKLFFFLVSWSSLVGYKFTLICVGFFFFSPNAQLKIKNKKLLNPWVQTDPTQSR